MQTLAFDCVSLSMHIRQLARVEHKHIYIWSGKSLISTCYSITNHVLPMQTSNAEMK